MTKERLKQYQHIKRERDQIKAMLEELEATLTAPKTQRLDGMPHSPSGKGSPMDAVIDRHITLQNRYRIKLAELDALQAEIEDAIEGLDSVARTLMRLRYIQGLKWEEVCVAMNYSWRQVHNLHSRALEVLRDTQQ